MRDPHLERGKDPSAVAAFHRHDERETELLSVGGIELCEALELFGRAFADAGAGLLLGTGLGQLALHGGLAGQVRVRIDQCQACGVVCLRKNLAHAFMYGLDLVAPVDRQPLERTLGDPRRMLVDVGEGRHELGAVQLRRLQGTKMAH
jgi:hypothetical protein